MKIHNVRLGHATNSSSSHSIVIVPNNQYTDSWDGFPEFGWEQFILSSPEAKTYYLAAQIYENLRGFEESEKKQIVEELFDIDFGREEPIVDHQSVLRLNPNSQRSIEFFKEFSNYLINDPNIVIFGGNDNGGDIEEAEQYERPSILEYAEGGNVKMKKDGDYWILFNKSSGGKTRFSFRDNAPPYTKANTPELIDIKLTGYCNFGCSFCYQSSTKEGQHANFEDIGKIAKSLKELEVFEVALGGGEPTTHPRFKDILHLFHLHDIVPNFTSFSANWMDQDIADMLLYNKIGGVGISIHKPKDLKKIHKLIEDFGQYHPVRFYNPAKKKIVAQHVVGTVEESVTREIIKQCNEEQIPLLLLGFKEVGFGEDFQNNKPDLETTLKLTLRDKVKTPISVDTQFLSQYPRIPQALGIDPKLYDIAEGKFSCYIDAVEGKMAPSSYVERNEYLPIQYTSSELDTNDFLEKWNKW